MTDITSLPIGSIVTREALGERAQPAISPGDATQVALDLMAKTRTEAERQSVQDRAEQEAQRRLEKRVLASEENVRLAQVDRWASYVTTAGKAAGVGFVAGSGIVLAVNYLKTRSQPPPSKRKGK